MKGCNAPRKVVALSGGVGGAKLAAGLAAQLPPIELTVIVNTGDDFDHLGLRICPDLDTVTYTLAGLENPETGWGRASDTWHFMDALEALGGPVWFRLSDRDLALHVERTRRLQAGQALSAVTADLARRLGVRARLLPMSDDRVPTRVDTEEGELAFQEYFVARRCQPRVRGFRFEGMEKARPAPGVLEALDAADLVVFGPSNPWVSLDPILAVPGLREAIRHRPALAVSPIVGGRAIKGPAAKMFAELGIEASARAVAEHYAGLVAGMVIDRVDQRQEEAIRSLGMRAWTTDTLMSRPQDRARLAGDVLRFGAELLAAERAR